MKSEFIKSLGWVPSGFWNNRMFYNFCGGCICVHLYDDSCYYVSRKGIRYDCKFSEDTLTEYTKILLDYDRIIKNPESCSLQKYKNIHGKCSNFYRKLLK